MKKVWIFIAVCLGLSWGAAGAFHLSGAAYKSLSGTLFASCYMFFPMLSVVITQLLTGEKPFSGCGVTFKIRWWWLVAGLFGMQFFCLLTLPVSALFPGVAVSTDSDILAKTVGQLQSKGLDVGPWGILGISLGSAVFAACTINALFAFGEEVAWRGFLSRCLDSLGFWKKSLSVGALWGVWHAPLILMGHNYPEHPVAGVFMMVAFCVLMAPPFQLVRDKSRSVIGAAVMHGSLNASAGLSLLYLSGFDDLLCGCSGLAGLCILLLADILLFAVSRVRG